MTGVEPRAFQPWLYTISRNRCLSVLRSPREAALARVDESVAATQQTADRVEQRAEVRELLSDVADLPEQQRAALLLSEICALSHVQIAEVIDCPREKVKSLVFQARVSLSLDREARETPCGGVREQLAGASRSWWSLGLRRHLKRCEDCREFAAPKRDRDTQGPQTDRGGPRPKPDHGGPRPKPDHGKMTCENSGGTFVDVNPLVHACVFTQPNRRPRRDQTRRTCERNGGSLADVSPLVHACVLPGGTMPDPFPALP